MTILRKRKIGKGASDMTKKILILSGSPRKQGNSDLLCDEFMRGALEAGHTVEKIRVQEKKVAYCTACYACRDTGNCAIKDAIHAKHRSHGYRWTAAFWKCVYFQK